MNSAKICVIMSDSSCKRVISISCGFNFPLVLSTLFFEILLKRMSSQFHMSEM